jgi:hypothetical protein
MEQLIAAADGTVVHIAADYTEGDNPRQGVVALGNLPVFSS